MFLLRGHLSLYGRILAYLNAYCNTFSMGGLQNLNEERLRRFLTLSLALFMGASLFYVCFRYVLPWCLPFLLALLVAALLEPVVLYLRWKFHFQRGFSALILTLTLLFLLGGLLSLLWSTLLSQTNALLAAAPAFFDAIPAAADDLLSRLEQFSASSPEWLSGYLHEQLFRAVTDADSLLRSLSSRAMAWLGSPSRRACLRSSSPPRRTPSSARHSNTPCRKKRWQSCGSFAAA